MADKRNEHVGASTSALPDSRVSEHGGWDFFQSKPAKADRRPLQPSERQTPPGQSRWEGVTVVGEAIHHASPESAEFLIEFRACASTAAQAFRDNQMRIAHVAQIFSLMGVQMADLHTVSLDISLVPQIGWPMEVPFGPFCARNVLRVIVREPGHVGDMIDTAVRAGAAVAACFTFKPVDEVRSQRAVIEAAGKDARAKAEALAASAERPLGDPIAISEEIVAPNDADPAFRSAFPFAFGAGAPRVVGELEYYARVSATFRFR